MAEDLATPPESSDPRRGLPSVTVLLESPRIQTLIAEYSRPLAMDAIRATLDGFRRDAATGSQPLSPDEVVREIERRLLSEEKERLRPVVNATGVILHTGLGRAALPQRAVDALASLNRCVNLEIDLGTGGRGKRNPATEALLTTLTGAEAAVVVANNAAATFLILAVFAAGKEVIISRGQMIEIGGSFRLPDCIQQSGATMVEVGTTNKTHLCDYENALTENTAVILRCNPSNYRIVGFTQSVTNAELASLKKQRPFILVDDLGCGALVNLEAYGLPREPTVQDSVAAGADLVCFSGDKLIGGPQAGVIVGRMDLIAQIKKHPLARMVRVGKLTNMALEHTLRLFLTPETLAETNPTYRMLATPVAELRRRATRIKKGIVKRGVALNVALEEAQSATGGGTLPATPIRTCVLAVACGAHSPDRLAALLRGNEPPIIPRVAGDKVLLDMRTLLKGDEKIIVEALARIASSSAGV